MTHLTLSNISKHFGDFAAVSDFNLEVERGEFVSFLGPSGCGKTTTLRMIAGFENPSTGMITIDGADITNKAPSQRNVGMVFQSYALFPNMTVAENIAFGLKIRKESDEAVKKRVNEMLALIHLEERGDSYPYQLSGGQQQRVALGRALAIQPEVLLLDEPLSALDAKIRVSLRAEIRAIQKKLGITAIYVTHDQEEALSISDRIVVMSAPEYHDREIIKDPKVEQIGTPFQIYNFPQTKFVASFVGTLNMAEVEVIDPAQGLLSLEGLQLQTEGHKIEKVKGDKMMIAVRPERFRFVTEGEKENILDCTIENITFLGSVVRIQMQIGKKMFNMDTFNRPSLELPKIGDRRQVTCSRKAVILLAE
jgi:putative spermidine/putrescine transport system ATP-binding protein